MLFPAFLYGLYRDVNKRCTKLVKATTSLDAYGACVLSMGMVDTAQAPGLFALDGPSELLGGKMTYQAFLPLPIIRRTYRENTALIDALFQEHLKTAWGTLLLMGNRSDYWFHEGNYRAYLEAVFTHWEELTSVGPRYTNGSDEGKVLMEVPSTIAYTFVREHRLTVEEANRIPWQKLFYEMKARWDQTRTLAGPTPLPGS